MLITKKRYNKIKKSKNQSRKLPKRRKKQKKFRRSFRKRHLDLKRKTLKNRKKRVMKGGSLSAWVKEHPTQYAEALSAGIDRRTLENAYRSITQGMAEGEKFSYDKNNLTSNSGKLLSGNDIPETFNKQVTRIINKKKAIDAEKKANENKGVNLSPTSRGRRRAKTPGLPPRGPPTGKEIVERTKAEEIKRKQLIQKRKKGVEKRRTAKRRYRRSPEAKKRRAARKRQTRSKKRKASQKGSSMINNIITRNIQDIAAKQAEESSTNENSPSVPITGTDNIEMGKVGKSETSTNISENTNTNLTRFPIVPSHPVALETDKPKIKEKRKGLLPPLSPTNIDIMYKRAKIPRKAGYIPALPMDLKTTPRAYASDRMPYGYVNIGFLKAQENNPGPGTWMPSTTGIPFVASSWITKKRPAGKRRKKTPPPRVIFPSRQSSISSSNIAGQKTDDQTIRPEIAGASTNATVLSPEHPVTSLKIQIKALKRAMKRIESEPWGKDAFKSISSGRKIKANVQRLSRNINAQKSKTPAILDYYKRQIAEQQRQLIILTKNLQNAGAKQNSNSNNNLHVGRSVTSRNTTRRPTYNASSGSNTGNAPIVPIGLGYKSETPEKEDKNDDIFALDSNVNNSNNEMELNEIPVTKDNSRNNDNSSSSDSESDDDNRSNNDNSNNDGGGGSGGITAGAPGRKINLGGDKWVNIRTNIQANPAQVIVTGKIGDNAADTLAILGS